MITSTVQGTWARGSSTTVWQTAATRKSALITAGPAAISMTTSMSRAGDHHWPPAITVSATGDKLVATSWFYNSVMVFDPVTHQISQQYWDFSMPVNGIMFQGQLVVAEAFHGVVMGNEQMRIEEF